ncbi:MAG: hypothetical protein M3P31_00075 [Actinomycetota bacterium]|nr:hypothetical protein [Actinomycetota bacterium]
MTVAAINETPPTVIVGPRDIVLHDFVENDRTVVSVVADAADPETQVHTLLRIGAAAVAGAGPAIDTNLVEARFGTLDDRFRHTVTEAVETVQATTESLVGEDGGVLTAVLDGLKQDLGTLLDTTFDADSKSSVIAKVEAAVAKRAASFEEIVRQALDPEREDSPLARGFRRLQGEFRSVQEELRQISDRVLADAARADVIELTTGKGLTFEAIVHDAFGRAAAQHHDVIEHVGRSTGAAGTQKGDSLVRLCEDDVLSGELRFVVEVKAQKLTMPKTLAELDKALDNHSAQAAIAVFDDQASAPTSVPFHPCGNRAILVLDRDDPDPRLVDLAYCWARWVARRQQSTDLDTIDVERIDGALDRAAKAIASRQSIRAAQTAAKKKIDESGAHVDALVAEVDLALREIREALR